MFRHDPRKAVLADRRVDTAVCWEREPAVCGYRRFSHSSSRLDRAVPVPICSSPAVVTGVGVVVGSYDGRVRLLSRNLDKVFWEHRLDSPIYAALVVDQARRTVVVAATSGLVTCFDLRGRAVWSTRLDTPVYATPTVLPDSGVLVVATFGSRCFGLDVATGSHLFARDLPRPWHAAAGGSAAHRDPYASPAATASGDVIICCAEHVLCLAPDGTQLWTQETGHAVRASPAVVHAVDEVAVCQVNGCCRFLDCRTGAQRGEVDLRAKIVASPALSGDTLVVGASDGSVAGVDVRRYDTVWASTFGAPRDHTSFTVLPSGDFVATSTHGNAVARRPDGRFLWETTQLLGLSDHDPAMDVTPMAGPDGSMYCASYSGVLYHFRFRPVSGELPR